MSWNMSIKEQNSQKDSRLYRLNYLVYKTWHILLQVWEKSSNKQIKISALFE